MKIFMYLLLSSLIILASCGGDDGGGGNGSGGGGVPQQEVVTPTLEVPIPPDQIDEIMNNQNFECAPIGGGSCPDGIARLMRVEGDGLSPLCSGFMINSKTLITNDHCVKSQEECNNAHISVYNGSGTAPFRTRCTRYIDSFEDFPDRDPRKSIDVSVLEIEGQFSGQTFSRASRRAEDGDAVTAWVIDHTGAQSDGNLLDSRITELSCNASVPGPGPALNLTNCPCVSGNSGSPLFNNSGNIVGVLWGCNLPNFGVNSTTFPLEERRGIEFAVGGGTEMIFFSATGVDENAGGEEPDPTTGGATGVTTTTGDAGTTGTETTTTGGDTGTTTTGGTDSTTDGTTDGGATGTTTAGTAGSTDGGATGTTTTGGTVNGTTTGGSTGDNGETVGGALNNW